MAPWSWWSTFVRKLSQSQPDRQHRNAFDAIRTAAFEVERPIFFSLCILIAAYLPLFTLELFRQITVGPPAGHFSSSFKVIDTPPQPPMQLLASVDKFMLVMK